ncbi:tryptophan synthase subunit alpha [Homoserinibacter sp. YIM 151385]|uniref:tryptophan synthase subunit alpha n=1 Tax=Homoserinibacter sp. YIM 151385 TaxID=2985506 RepID=UPI0022F07083|nr:tryptophan synthase subunit alpha [Homoserinibacter sp. YIM 151385]WBU38358.1 tryptophan synthase subunit alpha [Homoserinibacter sp. YIM 151385]
MASRDAAGGDHRRRASLEVLRAEAGDERATVVLERCLDGQDPWDFMEELPSVDELVVLTLRAETIGEMGGTRPGPEVDYRILRQIALAYPELTVTVWQLIGRLGGERRSA